MSPAEALRERAEAADREARAMRREMPPARPGEPLEAARWEAADKLARDREARARLFGRCAESAEACGAIETRSP